MTKKEKETQENLAIFGGLFLVLLVIGAIILSIYTGYLAWNAQTRMDSFCEQLVAEKLYIDTAKGDYIKNPLHDYRHNFQMCDYWKFYNKRN